MKKQKGEQFEEINVNSLDSDIYFLKINSGETSKIFKFIKLFFYTELKNKKREQTISSFPLCYKTKITFYPKNAIN
ncbi:MAG: T9SS type A sorting domain-containing protein [Saprospiraceae bacterium]